MPTPTARPPDASPGGPPFSFDEATGLLRPAAGGPGAGTLCAHLRALLARLLSGPGARVVSVTTSWSRTDLAVTLDAGPDLADLELRWLPAAPGVTAWRNDDTHYPVEFGVLCPACRQTLAWPQGAPAR